MRLSPFVSARPPRGLACRLAFFGGAVRFPVVGRTGGPSTVGQLGGSLVVGQLRGLAGDALRRESRFLHVRRSRRRRSETVDPERNSSGTHITLPAERGARLDRKAGPDFRREHAVAIRL